MSKNKDSAERVPALKPVPRKGRNARGEVYGIEGTNKTVPVPPEDAEPLPELNGTKSTYIPKTPYTRG